MRYGLWANANTLLGFNSYPISHISYLITHIVFTVLVVLSVSSRVQAAAGKPTANYLKVNAGARPVAMGGTQFGAQNDAFAPFYNPALISEMSRKEIGFMHNEFFVDFRQELVSFVQPTETYGNFSGAINYFSYGKIDGYDAQGSPTGDLSASDLALIGSWGKIWDVRWKEIRLDNLSSGASLKILRRNLGDTSALGVAIDLGGSYPIQWNYLKGTWMALSLQNLGPGVTFESESSPLPQTIRFGLMRKFWGEAFTTAFDFTSEGSGFYPSLGFEYRLLKVIAVRLGYKGDSNLDNQFTYGVGFENPLFRLDYSLVPFGDLGHAHRISVNYTFGKNYKRPKADDLLKQKVREAQTLYAQGLLVDAYLAASLIQRVAPWMDENNRLVAIVQKDFKELEASDKKEKLNIQITAILARAEKFFMEGNLINARMDFEAVLGLQPDNKTAQGFIKQIEAQFKSFVQSFYRNGMVAFAAENYDKAKEEFEKVLVIDPNHTEAKDQLTKVVSILEKKEEAMAEQAKQDTISKTYREALRAYQEDKLEEAIPLLSAVLSLNPGHEDAQRYISLARETIYKRYLNKGKDFASRGEWEPAMKNLKISLEYNPGDREIKALLGDVQRRWEFQKKVQSQNLYKQGLESFLSGDKTKAREIWQKALSLDPENEEAKRGLSRITGH